MPSYLNASLIFRAAAQREVRGASAKWANEAYPFSAEAERMQRQVRRSALLEREPAPAYENAFERGSV